MHLLSILELSLAEDGPDLTTEGVFVPGDRLQAIIVAKEQTIIAGLPVIPLVMDLCAAHPEELSYTWQSLAKEGEEVAKGSIVARISGPARQVLRAERVILNFVSHLCGIANLTRRYAEKLEGSIRQTGVHACGVIIGQDDLEKFAPMAIAKDAELNVVEFEGKEVESVGLIKMDFLGLRTLSIIKDAVENVKAVHGVDVAIDDIPLDDAPTY